MTWKGALVWAALCFACAALDAVVAYHNFFHGDMVLAAWAAFWAGACCVAGCFWIAHARRGAAMGTRKERTCK